MSKKFEDNCCIIVPIYKVSLDELELRSIVQLLKVLKKRNIFFVHPENLNLYYYKDLARKHNKSDIDFVALSPTYFYSIIGYNKLMISSSFYKKFSNFNYMLIYQADCYIFEDNLDYWCAKNYDYIGGIWFENYTGNPENDKNMWLPGNGGLSLRKTKSIITLLNSKKPYYNYKELKNQIYFKNKKYSIHNLKKILKLIFMIFGYRNNINYFAKTNKKNEDVFIMTYLRKTKNFKVPNVKDAIFFSWDRRPDYLYNKYKKLPMAVHAWFRDDDVYKENKTFWKKFIN